MTKFKRFFPQNKNKFKGYFKIFWPIVLGSTLFALNGFVDNFMVGHIEQAVTALGSANSWTSILFGIFIGTAAAGSVVMAQYYHAGKYETVKEIAKLRYLICLTIAIIFALLAWTIPNQLNGVFLKKQTNSENQIQYLKAMENAKKYIQIISLQWILMSITFNLGNQFREIGYGKITMYWGLCALITNISLNSILMYGLNFGVEGAAIASIAGRVVPLIFGITFIIYKKLVISFKIWTIFNISKHTIKEFFGRWFIIISFSTSQFFIVFRLYFYGSGYPIGSIAPGVGAVMVLGLTGAIVNVFITIFSAIGAMASNFVASELGKGNFKQAKINSDELKGFNTFFACILSIGIFIAAAIMPYLTFLSRSNNIEILDNITHLKNVRNSLFVLGVFFPIWIWFVSSYRNGVSGGKGKPFALIDWFFGGPIQLGWLAIIMWVFVPNSKVLQNNFALSYFIFFLSDLIKLALHEYFYFKYNWLHSLTKKTII